MENLGLKMDESGLKLKLAQVARATRLMMAHVFNGIEMHSCEML